MINLSKRLKRISEYVSKDDNVLDVGCDHALLDIYLSKKYNKIYYASDLKENRLLVAKENLKKYDADKVLLKCGNGLEVLKECKNIDTIIISGMGYMTITHILKEINKYNINKLIIQSNSNPEIVRKFMIKKGFYIDKESVVYDKNFYYVVTCYKKGSIKYKNEDIIAGIIDIDFDYKKYLDCEIKKNNVLLKVIPRKYVLKRFYIKRVIKILNKKKNSI